MLKDEHADGQKPSHAGPIARQGSYSLILATATRYLVPLLLLFAFFMLLRGHNEPGGGFVGGLVAASAIALYALANGLPRAVGVFRMRPMTLIGIGLLAALASGTVAALNGLPFLTGLWSTVTLGVVGKLGTPLLFDVGVFLVVVGVTLLIIFSLMEE